METEIKKRTDADILNNAPVDVELCGKVYKFCEPSRRRARMMVADIVDINATHNLAQYADMAGIEGESPERIGALMRAFDDMIPFIANAIGVDEDVIEEADETELGNAFAAISGVIHRPFTRETRREVHTGRKKRAKR